MHGLDRLDEAAVRMLNVLADELHACQLERDEADAMLAGIVQAFDGKVPNDPTAMRRRAHDLVVAPIERAESEGLRQAIIDAAEARREIVYLSARAMLSAKSKEGGP